MDIDWSYMSKYTDKFRNDPSCGHSFDEVYEPYLKNSKRILEVGTQQGGFIKFCKDQLDDIFYVGADLYVHPKAGANSWVNLDSFNHMADKFYVGNAFHEDFINWVDSEGLTNSFDLVIDDGPHTVESQVWLIQRADVLLDENGVFICEDVAGIDYANQIKAASPFPDQTRIWDNSEKTGRWDDICVIIDRRNA